MVGRRASGKQQNGVLNLSRKLYEMIDGELYEFDIGRFLWESSSTLYLFEAIRFKRIIPLLS